MSRFLLLNFKDFGLNQDITQTIQSQTLACICCLDSNVPLINLSTCKHEIYLQNFYKTVAEPTKKVVCLECHNVLKMIETFRQQVVNSFQRLTEEVTSTPPQNYNKHNKKKYNLTEKKTVNIYLPPAKYTAEKWQPQPQINKIVKKEVESVEPALPVVKIKAEPVESEREKVEIEIVPVKKQEETKAPPDKNPAVRTVTLTKEQLVMERLKQAQSPGYLKLPYRCESCVVGFNYEENIQDHMKRKHGPKVGSVTCDVCLAVLHPPGSLAAHMFRHLTRYECMKCDARYPSYDDTLHHYKRQHGDCLRCAECHYTTEITCNHCGMKFATATHLRMHVQFSDHPKQTFQCPDCPKEFAVEAEMKQHRNIHKKQRLRSTDRICDYCGRVYTSREHLIRHIQTHLLKRQKAKELKERAKSTKPLKAK
ncbi:zinc finger protein 184-like isoform X4 [Cydia strobilella]|uniref:zinc finger protein 184-like isoform X4 n=1 Tax=Cydia strobilella TaxID=1100964 RepID=UPI0030063D23